MKKKCKLLLKVNNNVSAKLYVNGKWQKKVTRVDIHAEPYDFTVEFDRIKTDDKGKCIIKDNEIVKETVKYQI
jgi:hypothetical protein